MGAKTKNDRTGRRTDRPPTNAKGQELERVKIVPVKGRARFEWRVK